MSHGQPAKGKIADMRIGFTHKFYRGTEHAVTEQE